MTTAQTFLLIGLIFCFFGSGLVALDIVGYIRHVFKFRRFCIICSCGLGMIILGIVLVYLWLGEVIK